MSASYWHQCPCIAIVSASSLTIFDHSKQSCQHTYPTCSTTYSSHRNDSESYGSCLQGPDTDSLRQPSVSTFLSFSSGETWQARGCLSPQPFSMKQCNVTWGPWGSRDLQSCAVIVSYCLCPHRGPLCRTLHGQLFEPRRRATIVSLRLHLGCSLSSKVRSIDCHAG